MIALATRCLDEGMTYLNCQSLGRDIFEQRLTFLGFLVMENKLKQATNETIKTLNECNVRTIMATGDNTLTAISVARNCGILEND